jgi:hypothetical protein
MILNSPYITGSLTVTGNIITSGSITISGSIASSSYALTASNALTLEGLGSASFAPASTFNTVSQSYAASSASLSTRVTTNETNISTLTAASASFAVASGSISGRVTLIEGQYATTGSNTFTGVQYVSQASNAISFTSTASLYTDGGLRVAKDSFVSGTAYFNNITVYGTSSIEYITSSQVNIGSNIITVNTDTPAVRFGGLSVFDSGSTQLTGSLFWDSEKNHWIYSNPSGSSYNSAMLMNGPRNTGSLGDEQGTTNNALMKGQGGDHITSSQVIDDGTTVRIPGNFQVTGSTIVTGALTGSSATFSGNLILNASNNQIRSGNELRFYRTDNGIYTQLYDGGSANGFVLDNRNGDGFNFQSAGTSQLRIASTGAATFSSTITTAALSRIGDVYIGGRSGTYASYTDGIFGDNLHLGATGATGGVFINAALSRACIINPVGGNVAIGTTSANTNSALTLNQTTNYTFLSLYNASSNANSRNWAIGVNNDIFGDFAIKQSNALNGDPTSGTSRLYISNTGQVAIGTNNPVASGTQKFMVTTSAASEIARFTDSTNADIIFDTPSEAVARITAQYGAGGNLVFARGTGRIESMRITSDGNVIIQRPSSGATLLQLVGTDAYGDTSTINLCSGRSYIKSTILVTANGDTDMAFGTQSGGVIAERLKIGSDGRLSLKRGGGTVNFDVFLSGGGDNFCDVDGQVFRTKAFLPIADNTYAIGSSGSRWTAVWAVNGSIQTSDKRQKKNIIKSDLGIDFVNKLNPVKYNWIDGDAKIHYGLIAQEVESLNIADFGALYIEDDKYGLNYSEFIAPMIKAIQELKAELDQAKARIETLEK